LTAHANRRAYNPRMITPARALFVGSMVLVLASPAVAQQGRGRGAAPPMPPPSMFKEVWKQPPYTGQLNDETRRATQEAVTNPNLELKLYGAMAKDVGVYNHEGRFDLWNGVVKSPIAIMLRDKASYADLTGLARLRATVRTMGLHVVYPVVRLADGSYVAGSRGIDTGGDFLETDIAFGGMRWHKFDPASATTGAEVKNPDLSKVDEIGFVDLAPGGGHGVSGAFNLSTIELFARTVPR
jgi:hypothetical protein